MKICDSVYTSIKHLETKIHFMLSFRDNLAYLGRFKFGESHPLSFSNVRKDLKPFGKTCLVSRF